MGDGVAPKAAAPGVIDPPVMAAADAVVLGAIGLDTGEAALGAGTARMEPLPVGVEHVLNIILAGIDPVAWPECIANMIPRFAFDSDQVQITVKVAVSQ